MAKVHKSGPAAGVTATNDNWMVTREPNGDITYHAEGGTNCTITVEWTAGSETYDLKPCAYIYTNKAGTEVTVTGEKN